MGEKITFGKTHDPHRDRRPQGVSKTPARTEVNGQGLPGD
jgi:hypothetical protein